MVVAFAATKNKLFFKSIFNPGLVLVLVITGCIVKSKQSESIDYLKKLKEPASEKVFNIPLDRKVICISQRGSDYIIPAVYRDRQWWFKKDLRNIFYLGPAALHPACKMRYNSGAASDLVYTSVKDSNIYWALNHGYEADFIYDSFDETIIDYLQTFYNIKTSFNEVKFDNPVGLKLYKLKKANN
jgi:hypothetical protein